MTQRTMRGDPNTHKGTCRGAASQAHLHRALRLNKTIYSAHFAGQCKMN